MACKVNWTRRAWSTYDANIKYLQEAWTQKEINNFILLTDRKIANLSSHPRAGRSRNKKHPDIRYTVVHNA
ncbi:MAG TPA: hypothetical protein VNV85_13370 [Puia sp.]|jgi:plasmid stabilization system protein ParE|nr:hypothetical protein [Puia sp.]